MFFLVAQTEQYQIIQDRTAKSFVQASEGSYDSATGNRLVIYKLALKVAQHFPFGVGPNNFRAGGKAVIVIDAMNHEDVTVKD